MNDEVLKKVLAYIVLIFCGFLLCLIMADYLPYIIIIVSFIWATYYLIKNKK